MKKLLLLFLFLTSGCGIGVDYLGVGEQPYIVYKAEKTGQNKTTYYATGSGYYGTDNVLSFTAVTGSFNVGDTVKVCKK